MAAYKRTVGGDDLRRRRDSHMSQLRKSRMNESLQKRRQLSVANADNNNNNDDDDDDEPSLQVAMTEEMWLALLDAFARNDVADVLERVTLLRHALNSDSPPVADAVGRGVVPLLARCLQVPDNEQLVLESAWALTNIAAADATATYAVVEANVVPICVHVIETISSEPVRDLCIWIIGNVAGEDTACRDHCFAANVHLAMVQLAQQSDLIVGIVRSCAWALSNLCRGAPPPPLELIGPCLPTLAQMLLHDDRGIVVEALWAFQHLFESCDDDATRQAIVDCGVCPSFARLLGHSDSAVSSTALRCTGSIVGGSAAQTDAMLRANPWSALTKLLKEKRLATEVCWVISNVTAGEPTQIQAVIDEGLLTKITALFLSGDFSLRREATWALCNAIVGSTNDQVCDIVDEDVIDALVAMARVDDTTMVVLALDALNRVLTVGAEMGEVEDYLSDWFAEREGPEMLQELLDTEQLEIYQRVDEILSHFFEDADDENGEENDDEEEGA